MNKAKDKIYRAGIYLLLILTVNAGYLFCKVKDISQWSSYIKFNRYVGFPINQDAMGYIIASAKPSRLFAQNELRQSRPLYIIQNTVIGYSLMLLTRPFHESIAQNSKLAELSDRIIFLNQSVVDFLGNKAPFYPNAKTPEMSGFEKSVVIPVFYMAYIFSNLIILLLSLFIFEQIWTKLTDVPSHSLLFFASCWFLLISVVGKYFFWTTHQDMCSLLCSLSCVLISLSISDGSIGRIGSLLLCLLGGFLMLYYGNFLLLFPSILLPYLWRFKRESLVALFKFSMIAAVLFALPTLLWISLLRVKGIVYYNAEIDLYRQLVWIFDITHLPVLLAIKTVYSNTIHFFNSCSVIIPTLVWLVLVFLLFKTNRTRDVWKSESGVWILIYTIICLSLFYLLGYYKPRLTFNVAVGLFCFTPYLINKANVTNFKNGILVISTLVWYLYFILY